jgi:hypothetical protein
MKSKAASTAKTGAKSAGKTKEKAGVGAKKVEIAKKQIDIKVKTMMIAEIRRTLSRKLVQ